MPVTPQGEIIDPSAGDASNQLDCVICHGTSYNGGGKEADREVLLDENGNSYWSLASLEDARTVGDKVTASACKRCHVNTGGRYSVLMDHW